MKIVFFGSSEFAVPSLERLLGSWHEILAVVTQPDRKSGRHLKKAQTPVKTLALHRGLKIHQPESVADRTSLRFLRSLQCELFVVVAFGQILPGSVLEIPKLYSVNLHASLLPKYRGAAPINWAIIKGETETGLSIIRMNEKMDAGDIVLQRAVEIEREDNAQTLEKRLSNLGAVLLLDMVRFIEENRVTFKKQDEKKVSFAPKLKKEDGLIDWTRPVLEIHNKVRGTIPWPGAYTYFNNKKMNIWKTSTQDGKANPGEVVLAKKELVVGTGKGLLRIEEIQIEGRKRMNVAEFLRGMRELKKGVTLGV